MSPKRAMPWIWKAGYSHFKTPAGRKKVLENAKIELRDVFGK
ncbi:MAG: hypothetical protein ABIJ26_05185 [Candidatus Margulisiibacteriota bacterium]